MIPEPLSTAVETGSVPRLFVAEVASGRAAAEVAQWMTLRHPASLFVVVLSSDLGDELASVLTAVATVRAEVVCVDALGPSAVTADETANTVLDLGVRQDFVFTLPRLSDAIDYALQRVEPGDAAHWDAQAVLVIGPPVFVDGARPSLR